MYKSLNELPNNLRLAKIVNFKIIPEIFEFDDVYQAVHPKAKFWRFWAKNCKKSDVKHSTEKPILLNFVNLSPPFRPRLRCCDHMKASQLILKANQLTKKLRQSLNLSKVTNKKGTRTHFYFWINLEKSCQVFAVVPLFMLHRNKSPRSVLQKS